MAAEPKTVQKRVRIATWVLLCILLMLILATMVEWGVPASRLEQCIRASQHIPDSWTVSGTASKRLAAYLCYPENRSDSTYSIYINRPGVSFGYRFRSGGGNPAIDEQIAAFSLDYAGETVFLSMNVQQVKRAEINDGQKVQDIPIDSEKPFALVLPNNEGIITFYDQYGNPVEYFTSPL